MPRRRQHAPSCRRQEYDLLGCPRRRLCEAQRVLPAELRESYEEREVRASEYKPDDFKPQSRFALLDLSLKNAMGPHPDAALPHAISSDRACQLSIKIVERWRREFPEDAEHLKILLEVLWGIPKLHVHGHKEDCQFCMHFAYLFGCGRTCGEGVERPWPETNATGMITKDANLGHREDILNDTQGDWNHKKVLGIGGLLI